MTIRGFWKWPVVCAAVIGIVPVSIASVRDIPVMHRDTAVPASSYESRRVLVKYREDFGKSSIVRDSVRSEVSGTVVRSYRMLPGLESLEIDSSLSVESAVKILRGDPRVEYAEPNFVWSTTAVPNDEKFTLEWGLDNIGQPVGQYAGEQPGVDIDAPEAWEHGTGSSDIVVADLDEGCDYRHPDLAANIWTNPGEIPDNGVDDDGNGFVDDVHGWDFLHDDATTFDGAFDTTNSTDFHGTHTSGTIGAVGNNGIGVSGVCWSVQIMSLKFLENVGSTDDAIAAFDYAVSMKERGVNLRAINCSWGGYNYSQSLHDAIGRVNDADILVCASSGNGGSDGVGDDNDRVPSYPASFDLPNIISVGAWTRYDQAATFSNYGATSVDLLAPGGLVASTGPNGSYYFASGTSMAAPHVTGTVALIASLKPGLTGAQIKEAILSSTVPIPLAKPTVTGGRLSLLQAVETALAIDGGDDGGGGPPPPPPPPAPVVLSAKFSPAKNLLVVDGLRFTNASVIEIDSVAMPVMRFSNHDLQADGSYNRMSGKAPGRINFVLPKHQAVMLTVFDSSTGQRSSPLAFTRQR